ncbi:MAG: general secretion pathway protein GspK [Sedimentisphaerales bacterium]|nr:general secretion pathway protein GspK [Sedimentisphaerales bacterium]
MNTKYNGKGVALIIVLLMLTVLSIMVYTLTTRVMIQRGSEQYMIDYQTARYACDSAVKFALATITDINTTPIVRKDAPDFSDLSTLDEEQYRQLISNWAETLTPEQAQNYLKKENDYGSGAFDINSLNDAFDFNSLFDEFSEEAISFDQNNLQIPGPYGAQWPFITEPVSLEIGNSHVTIEIHDENAKYPIGWVMLDDPKVRRQIVAGFETFCEWMDVNDFVVKDVEDELKELNKVKEYKIEFKDIKITKSERVKIPTPTRGRSRSARTRYRNVTKTTTIPATVHLADFAKLYHSSFLDTESLARPFYVWRDRKESALKYISLWGTSTININSAPRPVLEAAFAFGGLSDSVEIARAVIERRKIQPFKNPDDLRNQLYGYSDSIDKCRQYISTNSDIFTIRITAKSGRAQASTVIAVKKSGKKIQRIAVLSG